MLDMSDLSATTDLISVALCTFNGELYLREQLDSLLAQDWPSLEIIAIDDASTDQTASILWEYARYHPELKVICNPVNLGYTQNFERAMSECRGRWIAPCDQDDIWLPHKLSQLAAELQQHPDALLAFCDSDLVDAHGHSMHQRLSDRIHRFSTDDPAPFLMGNMVSGHAVLFCRDLLQVVRPFPEEVFHDWWLAYGAISAGPIRYVDECLVHYRQHDQSLTDITGRRTRPQHRKRGFRSVELLATRRRLELFAHVPGRGEGLVQELLSHWRHRETQFVSYSLVCFMWKYSQRLGAFQKTSTFHKKRQALKFLWGLRTHRLLQPHRYVYED